MHAATMPASFDAPAPPPVRAPEDAALIRDAARITRDLNVARPRLYWTDLALSAGLGYAALAVALIDGPLTVRLAAGVVAIFALYRAGSFIHEIAHLTPSAVPGFRTAWNVLVGIPLLVPSFLYEGVHNLHHAKTRYGTAEDPEYLPLALMKPLTLLLFIAASLVAPLALLVRFGIVAPLALVVPQLREAVTSRYSALAINPAFRRRAAEAAARTYWHRLEIAASLWALALIGGVVSGVIPFGGFLIFLAVASGVAVLNQVRTLVAHLWENDGDAIGVTAQYLDSVNVPPPSWLPALWAPVGLRYHALHHLLPGLPYHALGEAHRRLAAALPEGSTYHRASYKGLPGLVVRLVAGARHQGSPTSHR